MIAGPSTWLEVKQKLSHSDSSRHRLEEESDACLQTEILSVVAKDKTPAGGDRHDYFSLAPYWWPDPSRPDGIPYLRRDGEFNPESRFTDRQKLESLCHAVAWLALRAGLGGSLPHAEHAGRLLRAWFVDPATRMNPNLRFAQGIPGHCDGRGIGLIDSFILCFLIDLVGLLPDNSCWNRADRETFRLWFANYLDWFLHSQAGRDECREHNNHGTWYDAQVCRFALFCNEPGVAKKQLEQETFSRLRSQILPDGSQPHELARTLSLNYCSFNLLGFACLAQSAAEVGLDLWHWRDAKGPGLLAAFNWMKPYYAADKKWAWPQIGDFNPDPAALAVDLAGKAFRDQSFCEIANGLSPDPWKKAVYWKDLSPTPNPLLSS